MKRISLVALSLACGFSLASAQYRAGTSSAGGTFSFSLPDTGPKTLTISPSYDYSITDKLAIGAEVFFTGEGEARAFGVAPYVRGNLPVNEKAGIFVRASPVYLYMHLGDSFGDDVTGNAFGFGADAGIYYWISQRFSVELTLAELYFLNTTIDVGSAEVADESDFAGGLTTSDLAASVRYHF